MASSQSSGWKPRFSFLGFISGAFLGGGGLLMMQQSGNLALAPAHLANMVISALAFGVVIPTMIHGLIGTMRRPAPATVGAALLLAAVASAVATGSPAAAQGCSLSVNGQAVSAGTTVTVAEDADLKVAFSGTEVTGGKAAVTFGPVEVYTDSFTLTEPKTGAEERTFDRSKIADKGVGLYSINAVVNTTSSDCAFDFYINVEGDPLGTPAGKGAAAALGLGALGSLATIAREIASALAQAKAALA